MLKVAQGGDAFPVPALGKIEAPLTLPARGFALRLQGLDLPDFHFQPRNQDFMDEKGEERAAAAVYELLTDLRKVPP
jgi:hypothetical protein